MPPNDPPPSLCVVRLTVFGHIHSGPKVAMPRPAAELGQKEYGVHATSQHEQVLLTQVKRWAWRRQ